MTLNLHALSPESEWKLYRDFRLHALKSDPDSFCSTVERESKLTEEEWKGRASNCVGAFLLGDQEENSSEHQKQLVGIAGAILVPVLQRSSSSYSSPATATTTETVFISYTVPSSFNSEQEEFIQRDESEEAENIVTMSLSFVVEIVGVFVDRQFRGKQIGEKLVNFVTEDFIPKKYTASLNKKNSVEAFVYVRTMRDVAQTTSTTKDKLGQFYTRCGFEEFDAPSRKLLSSICRRKKQQQQDEEEGEEEKEENSKKKKTTAKSSVFSSCQEEVESCGDRRTHTSELRYFRRKMKA